MKAKRLRKRPLTIREILAWTTVYRESTGRWPTQQSGDIAGSHGESWKGVDLALRQGLRGFPGGSSLAQLLAQERGVRNRTTIKPLTEQRILKWADEHRQRTGQWPTITSGTIADSGGEKWSALEVALRSGARRLPGGSSLARLLAEHRGVRNPMGLPPLTEAQILTWADAHHARTGVWPNRNSGPIPEAPGETWRAVQSALTQGNRTLPGGSSLARLLAERRNVRNVWTLPDLAITQVLAWVDAHHARTGAWPNQYSGPIPEAPGETWGMVNHALKEGTRGLPGGCSLAQWLAAERAVRNYKDLPDFSRKSVLAWADAWFRRTGSWPAKASGPIPEAPGETWLAVDSALLKGSRGFRAGSSLARFLAQHRGKKNLGDLPPLSHKKILAWADAHHQRTGDWPNTSSGKVVDAPGERWDVIDNALRQGSRRLSGGSSLLKLLVKKRGVRNRLCPPPLSVEQIIGWTKLHRQRTGRWPTQSSGAIEDAPGETWAAIEIALTRGKRSLPGGSSLAKLRARCNDVPALV